MAKTGDSKTLDTATLNDTEKFLRRDYLEDIQAHDDATQNYDAYEAMHNSQTFDQVSRETTSGLTDSKTATIYLERAARVAGQLPTGEVKAFGKRDMGKALFMDLLLQKWIYPNANAQRSFRTKMFMWDNGSSEYGWMPMHYDLDVKPDGKVVPDCWLFSPRMFIPQAGYTSIADMDYCHALAKKSPSWVLDLLDEPDSAGWKKDAIEALKDQIKAGTTSTDPQRDTKKYRETTPNETRQIILATRYEAGKDGEWVTFLPEFGYKIIRRIKNPHKNGRIPFVIKPCIPTFDSFYNIGDYQRSMPMQFANDGLDNFYFQGIKVNLFPRTVIDAQAVIRHTMSNEAGAVIETNAGGIGGIKTLDTSTAGLSTYQAAKGMAQGAMQSIAGTTDTVANAESAMDPGFGKTPEALKMLQQRESTRDNQDRELLEEAMQELIDGMLSLIPTMKTKIPIDMFADEMAEIMKAHPDLEEIFEKSERTGLLKSRISESEEQIRLRLDPQKLQGLDYRFQLEPNSTMKKNKDAQLNSLMEFLTFMGKMPNALDQFREATGQVPNWQQIFNQFGQLADVPGMDNIFMKAPEPPKPPEPQGAQGGISPEQLAQAAAMPPEAIAQGGMQPLPPEAAPQPPQPGFPPEAVQQQLGEINPRTGLPYSPQMQAELQRIEALREDR
jgi:hypothetical protein